MTARTFDGLLRSEIRKAETLANRTLGTNDCKVTGYFTDGAHRSEICKDMEFVYVRCEICHDYEERADIDVWLYIPMFDRRQTRASLYAP